MKTLCNVLFLCIFLSLFGVTAVSFAAAPFLANGVKIGEVTAHEAIVWTRLTTHDGIPSIRDAAPGMSGEIRFHYWPRCNPQQIQTTGWKTAHAKDDYTVKISLKNLVADTRYMWRVETRLATTIGETTGETHGETLEGSFQTAPLANSTRSVRGVVVTCQSIERIDSGDNGHATYHYLDQRQPDFFIHTGDIVYYDRSPHIKNPTEARQLWNKMFSYRFNRQFHLNTTSYFEKDDHDVLRDDCVPGDTYHDMTYEQGQKIFLEQVPMGTKTYRTFRWGHDLQIWLTEARDFRTHPNKAPDSPEKSILGFEQREWLMKTLQESDATFKIVVSPGCYVGPDKPRKNDNHANPLFQHEGAMLREFFAKIPNTFVVNGDRHWQYHSVDPATGLNEFGCGPINDRHNDSDCGYQPTYHQFFCSGGGFLELETSRSTDDVQAEAAVPTLTFRYFGVEGVHTDSTTYEMRDTFITHGKLLDNPTNQYPVLRYEKTFSAGVVCE